MEKPNEPLLEDDLLLDDLDDDITGASREPEEEPQTITSLNDLLAIGKQTRFCHRGRKLRNFSQAARPIATAWRRFNSAPVGGHCHAR